MKNRLPDPLESDIQIQLVKYLNLVNTKGAFIFYAVPNEAMGNVRTPGGIGRMAKLKRMGLRSGVADLCFVWQGRAYFLELKRRLERQTVNQLDFESDAIRARAVYAVAHSFDEAVSILQGWGIIQVS